MTSRIKYAKKYGLKVKTDMASNPQDNYIVEIIHKILSNMVHTRRLLESKDLKSDWIGVISADAYGICSTHHTTMKECTGQLVFRRYLIFNISHVTN